MILFYTLMFLISHLLCFWIGWKIKGWLDHSKVHPLNSRITQLKIDLDNAVERCECLGAKPVIKGIGEELIRDHTHLKFEKLPQKKSTLEGDARISIVKIEQPIIF